VVTLAGSVVEFLPDLSLRFTRWSEAEGTGQVNGEVGFENSQATKMQNLV
jgi:hypothetical protein